MNRAATGRLDVNHFTGAVRAGRKMDAAAGTGVWPHPEYSVWSTEAGVRYSSAGTGKASAHGKSKALPPDRAWALYLLLSLNEVSLQPDPLTAVGGRRCLLSHREQLVGLEMRVSRSRSARRSGLPRKNLSLPLVAGIGGQTFSHHAQPYLSRNIFR